jgi:hypothetical protein
VIDGRRESQLVDALCSTFEIVDLQPVVELVSRRLAEDVTWSGSKRTAVTSLFRAARAMGADVLVGAVLRSARRTRRDHEPLGAAVRSCWPYAGGLTPGSVDELTGALIADQVRLIDLKRAAAGVVQPLPAVWAEADRDRDALADLVEQLAGCPASPGARLPLLRIAGALASDARPALGAWIAQHGPEDIAQRHPEDIAARATVPVRSSRMLIVLYPEDDDHYTASIFLSNASGAPQLITTLGRSSLADIPARIQEALVPATPLFEAMRTSEIAQIDVALPLRDLLAAVDEWTLLSHVLSIGESYRVVVRCLERNLAERWPRYLLGRQRSVVMWREMHQRTGGCAVHWIESPDQLAPHEVKQALRSLAVKKWLVAAMCADAPVAARQHALELMLCEGMPAAIAVRGAATASRPLLEPACAQHDRLPTGIHEHRAGPASLPVTLLWDDPDFRPEEWR